MSLYWVHIVLMITNNQFPLLRSFLEMQARVILYDRLWTSAEQPYEN